MALVPIDLDRVADELRGIIEAFDIVIGGWQTADMGEPVWIDRELQIDIVLHNCWSQLASSIAHIKHSLNQGEIDALDCGHSVRSTLHNLWLLVNLIPAKADFYCEFTKAGAPGIRVTFLIANFPWLARYVLKDLTGEVVSDKSQQLGDLEASPPTQFAQLSDIFETLSAGQFKRVRRLADAGPSETEGMVTLHTIRVPLDMEVDDGKSPGKGEAAAAPAAAGQGREPLLVSQCGRVKLFGLNEKPTVDDVEQPELFSREYDVLAALIKAGPDGYSKDKLDKETEITDSRKVIGQLRKKDGTMWKEVLPMPVRKGGGYRIR